MFIKNGYFFFLIFSSFISCYPIKQTQTATHSIIPSQTVIPPVKIVALDEAKTDGFFTDLFKKYPKFFDTIIAQAKQRNIQIIYTQVNRGANNSPGFKDYYF